MAGPPASVEQVVSVMKIFGSLYHHILVLQPTDDGLQTLLHHMLDPGMYPDVVRFVNRLPTTRQDLAQTIANSRFAKSNYFTRIVCTGIQPSPQELQSALRAWKDNLEFRGTVTVELRHLGLDWKATAGIYQQAAVAEGFRMSAFNGVELDDFLGDEFGFDESASLVWCWDLRRTMSQMTTAIVEASQGTAKSVENNLTKFMMWANRQKRLHLRYRDYILRKGRADDLLNKSISRALNGPDHPIVGTFTIRKHWP